MVSDGLKNTRHSVHPFPARMAPELAFKSLQSLERGSLVLDPMSGSGTVLRQANDFGLTAIGFDMDPLAVLMSRVWTTPVALNTISEIGQYVLREARALKSHHVHLDWLDNDIESSEFAKFWFGSKQLDQMRKLSYVLAGLAREPTRKFKAELDVIRVALSRIVITKQQCASLARDTSHSRPHRVALSSEYCCFTGFERSFNYLCVRLEKHPPAGGSIVDLGDARRLRLQSSSVDAVLTSPPYLNAIDYMRGHKLSLIWLGYRLSTLRDIRRNAIGAERSSDELPVRMQAARSVMGHVEDLPSRYRKMVDRYIGDIHVMVSEIARVLAPEKRATMVVGNSCVRGIYVDNSALVAYCAKGAGLTLVEREERLLPDASRYLPTDGSGSLSKRMRMETILTFAS